MVRRRRRHALELRVPRALLHRWRRTRPQDQGPLLPVPVAPVQVFVSPLSCPFHTLSLSLISSLSSTAVDGKTLFFAVVITGSLVLLALLAALLACCCWCCRRKSRRLQREADEEYIRNGGALDYKERRRQEQIKQQSHKKRNDELSEPLVSTADKRSQMRAKWGIGADGKK